MRAGIVVVVALFAVSSLVDAAPAAQPDRPVGERALVAPDAARPGPRPSSPGPGYVDTSEFFAGRVAVGVFLVESAGPAYVWSDVEVDETLGGIYAGLAWWAAQEPKARLFFDYELHVRVPTTWEPIENPIADDWRWINEILGTMGYSQPDPWSKARAYNHDLRARLGTDWAYAIFVADSTDAIRQGLFTDDQYAHAYLGGPWVTMSRYSSWAYNSANYHMVVPAHETGHIFYATDEYDGVISYSGYLNCADWDGYTSIMNRNSLRVSPGTACQLGWVDSDGDGALDILDVPPETTLTPHAPNPTNEATVVYEGIATVVPLPNENPRGPGNDVTISRIARVEGRTGGGSWVVAEPADGSFDGFAEPFRLTIELSAASSVLPLPSSTRNPEFEITARVGSYTGPLPIEARAVNTEGNGDATPATDVLEILPPSAVELWYSKDLGVYERFAADSDAPYAWTFNATRVGGDGVYRFASRAVDASGGREPWPATPDATVVVDTTPPTLAILSPGVGSRLIDRTAVVRWEAVDAGTGIAFLEIRLDDGPFVPIAGGTSYPFQGLADGVHTATIRVTDALGNAREANVTFRVHADWLSGGGPHGWLPVGLLATALLSTVVALIAWRAKRIRRRSF